LQFGKSEQVEYAYRLEGLNSNWIETDAKNRRIHYTSINSGDYTFKVRAKNDVGDWGEPTVVKISIAPPWWATHGAIFAWVALFVLLIYISYQIRVRNLKSQRVSLRNEVQKQTNEINQQKEELKITNEQLLELSDYKYSMTGMIVHDLKNPLNSIIGLTEGNYSPKHQQTINQSGKNMLHLVTNILEVQKLEEAQAKLTLSSINLYQLCHQAFEEVKLLVEEKNLKVHFYIDGKIWVEADHELILRVIINLMTNAIKYTAQNGSITVYHQLIQAKESHQDTLKIYVSDTGMGIPTNKQKQVFRKFTQVKGKDSGRTRSTGLGLAFCKMALDAHGQKIELQSEEGKGSTFSFSLSYQYRNESLDTKPKIAEIFPEDINNYSQVDFNEQDRIFLQPFINELKQFEVYEVTEVKKVLNKISKQEVSPPIRSWYESLEKTLYACNEEKYKELLILR